MKLNFQDPAIAISIGIILIGLALLVWAIGKFRKKSPPSESPLFTSDLPGGIDEPLPAVSSSEFSLPAFEPPAASTPAPISPPVSGGAGNNKEMASRLDTMAQKLTDMQSVLQRQAASGPAGTPLTPETIDKLLKIIGNVSQQVDLLHRSLGSTPTAPSPSPSPVSGVQVTPVSQAPAQNPSVTAFKPTTTPAPAIGGKSIGMTGGALSSFPKATPPGAEKKPGDKTSEPPAPAKNVGVPGGALTSGPKPTVQKPVTEPPPATPPAPDK